MQSNFSFFLPQSGCGRSKERVSHLYVSQIPNTVESLQKCKQTVIFDFFFLLLFSDMVAQVNTLVNLMKTDTVRPATLAQTMRSHVKIHLEFMPSQAGAKLRCFSFTAH